MTVGSLCRFCMGRVVKKNVKENQSVGEMLKACRLRAGKSQGAMAAHLNLDQSVISRIENDEVTASYTLVRQWCAFTNGMDLMNLDFTGSADGWKKLRQLEDLMRQMRTSMESVNFRRGGSGNVGLGAKLGRVFGRIRS